jgi:hypothetical protein
MSTMASETSVARTSFTAYFELIADGKSYSLGQVASDFVILRNSGAIPSGTAELIIRYDDQPEIHRQIEVIGPDAERPERIVIRRL